MTIKVDVYKTEDNGDGTCTVSMSIVEVNGIPTEAPVKLGAIVSEDSCPAIGEYILTE